MKTLIISLLKAVIILLVTFILVNHTSLTKHHQFPPPNSVIQHIETSPTCFNHVKEYSNLLFEQISRK